MLRLWLRLLCRLGFHVGRCHDGAFRCDRCEFVDPYYPPPSALP
jgi:hypothetical protein